jgi:hypothetical protein
VTQRIVITLDFDEDLVTRLDVYDYLSDLIINDMLDYRTIDTEELAKHNERYNKHFSRSNN